jgi:tRNA(fMet)-specific endonuclease VapC
MALIIDTSVLISLEREGRKWREVLGEDAQEEMLAIAAITASELLSGVYRANTERRRTARLQHVEEILREFAVLPFDLNVARIHARLWFELDVAGERIGTHDALIAATALANDASLLTTNLREFIRVPGLEVREPRW